MRARTTVALILVALVVGCGERREQIDVPPNIVDRARLGGELLFVDANRSEVDAVDVMKEAPTPSVTRISVTANPRLIVERTPGVRRSVVGAGGNIQNADPLEIRVREGCGLSPKQVLVLGDGSRNAGGDYIDMPSLTVIDQEHKVVRYELSRAFGQLLLSGDAGAHYALLWGTSTTGGSDDLLNDTNRVALIDLSQPPSSSNPIERTVKATGGSVTNAVITPELRINGELRPLALFSYGNGLSLWDLAHPDLEEITVEGLSGSNQFQFKRIVADLENAQLYLIQQNEPDLRVLTLGPATSGNRDFWPSWNQLPLGLSSASDMVFYTDASVPKVLVAAGDRLGIVDANDSRVATVPLSPAGSKMVSFKGASPNDNDVNKQRVLVWSEGGSSVSFVELGNLEKGGAQNIEVLPLGYALTDLIQLEGNLWLTVLGGGGVGTLDLDSRRFRPLAANVQLRSPLIESDARRVWVGGSNSDNRVGYFDPETLATGSLRLDSPVEEVFQFENDKHRRVAVTHDSPIGEMTIVDATTVTRNSSQVLTGFLVDGLVNR
jgi:hypothetical protein